MIKRKKIGVIMNRMTETFLRKHLLDVNFEFLVWSHAPSADTG